MNEPMEWEPTRRGRAHVTANITVAAALIIITALGAFYVMKGMP